MKGSFWHLSPPFFPTHGVPLHPSLSSTLFQPGWMWSPCRHVRNAPTCFLNDSRWLSSTRFLSSAHKKCQADNVMTSYGRLLFSNLSAFLMKRSRPNKRCFDLILHSPKTALTFTKIFSKCQICFAETRLKMACALARTRIRAKETSKSFVQLCGAGLG